MLNKAMFTSDKTDWETPPELFEKLDEEFGFDLDVCASKDNNKCTRFLDVAKVDSLDYSIPWNGMCWMNPPYGRGIGFWMEKARFEAHFNAHNHGVVCLVPARTDTIWWHQHVMDGASEVYLIKGRVKFVGAESSAPFPSAVVVYDGGRCFLDNDDHALEPPEFSTYVF